MGCDQKDGGITQVRPAEEAVAYPCALIVKAISSNGIVGVNEDQSSFVPKVQKEHK